MSGRAAAPTDERALVSTRLLHELVTQTLDPGYAAAAARRGDASPRRADTALTAVGALLIGLLLVVSYVHTNRGAPEAQRVHDDLVKRVRSAQQGADALAAQVASAQRELDAAQARALPAAGQLARELAGLRLAAAAVAVKGPGVVVTLREPASATVSGPPARVGTVGIAATSVLTDRDVRSVVNELWADGAEAIAINGVRLSPTSAIRFAGQAVLVNFDPITSPYRVEAIGSPDTLSTRFATSDVASRYQTLVSADHIGFDFVDATKLTLPAESSAGLRYARPVPSPTRSGR